MPKRNSEDIEKELLGAVRDCNENLLSRLLEDEEVKDFIKNLPPNNYLLNPIKSAVMRGKESLISKLIHYMPAETLESKILNPFATKQQDLFFFELGKHADNLKRCNLPPECINIIFSFAFYAKDDFYRTKMLAAAQGKLKL